MKKVAIIDDYLENALSYADWSVLANECEITVFSDHMNDPEELSQRLVPFDIVCCQRERTIFNRRILESLPNLKLLCSTAPRNAAIDLKTASELGIVVCGTGVPKRDMATAELTWGLILGLTRNIPKEDASIRKGRWQAAMGRDLKGLTLGVVGPGRLGGAVATIALALGMRVVAWSQNLTDQRCMELGIERVEKQTLFSESDVVTVHLVLSERSRLLIGLKEFSLMKGDAIFINTARGPIVDEVALTEALLEGSIGGAGLDVFSQEPLPIDHPLRATPNTLLTSHIGYATRDTFDIFFKHTVENIRSFLDGSPIRVMKV